MGSNPSGRSLTAIPHLFEAWSFAAETNRGDLLAAVPSFLALLLSTISGLIEFREVGAQLCQSVLTRESLRSLDKSLEAQNSKADSTTPCLRLLTEVVSFDGGAFARGVYNCRHVTWRRLPWLLNRRDDSKKSPKRAFASPTRHSALTYVLANLRLQSIAAKETLISVHSLFSSLFKNLSRDPPTLIKEVLDTVRQSVVLDKNMSLALKRRLLSESVLTNIASLYKYRESKESPSTFSVRSACHAFLLLVCTSKQGLREQPGCTPTTTPSQNAASLSTRLRSSRIGSSVDDCQEALLSGTQNVAAFLRILRPQSDLRQRELVLAVFETAPETVSEYFVAKQGISFEPNLSATWLGYAAFISSVQGLEWPSQFKKIGGKLRSPPHAAVVLQSILPEPMTQAVMTKCQNQSCLLIKFLGLRLVIQCLQKASLILDSYRAGEKSAEWDDTAEDLVAMLSSKLPDMKCLISNFRSCPAQNVVLRQAFSRALALYIQVVPGHAPPRTLDMSTTIAEALLPSSQEQEPRLNFRGSELANYLSIAYQSTEMRWWNGPGTVIMATT